MQGRNHYLIFQLRKQSEWPGCPGHVTLAMPYWTALLGCLLGLSNLIGQNRTCLQTYPSPSPSYFSVTTWVSSPKSSKSSRLLLCPLTPYRTSQSVLLALPPYFRTNPHHLCTHSHCPSRSPYCSHPRSHSGP